MPRFIERIKDRISDPTREFKERVFIVLNLIIDVLIVFALIGDIVFHENIVEITVLAVVVIITPIITLVSVRLNKVNFAIWFHVFSLIIEISF